MNQAIETPKTQLTVKPYTRDIKTADAVSTHARHLNQLFQGFLVYSIITLIVYVIKYGVIWGIFNSPFFGFFSFMVILVVKWIIEMRWDSRFYSCISEIKATVRQMGINFSMEQLWINPSPGIIVVDVKQRLVFVESAGTNYYRLVLKPEHIVGAKVEREIENHTHTKHSGGTYIYGKGIGYKFGGRSSSTTTTIERAFLEIHYRFGNDVAPSWVTIPFGSNRREAESMVIAIRQLKG